MFAIIFSLLSQRQPQTKSVPLDQQVKELKTQLLNAENLIKALSQQNGNQDLVKRIQELENENAQLKSSNTSKNNETKQNLLERIGGVKALHTAVDLFYDIMLADSRVSHYFKNTNMVHQRSQQKDFLQTVLGNQTTDAVYKGADMLAAHKNLNITNAAYDATTENLISALVKCGVPADVLNELGPIVESLRGDIVQATEKKTLLERIGGVKALHTAVDIFYDTMLADNRVSHYFKNTNMAHQRSQQKDFLQTVLGNQTTDAVYKGADMLAAHKHLNITNAAYDATCENLVNTLVKCGVDSQTLGEIAPIVESLRGDIVQATEKKTLLERIGGVKALHTAVDLFYDIMLADSRVSHYFKNTNMAHQRSQQKDFLQTVLGNQTTDAVYKGADMLAAHKHLNITNAAYDATAENLINALVKCGVPTDVLNELGPIVESLRGDIVQATEKKTLLERIGGVKALHTAVDLFYDIMLADSRVSHYFKNTNMAHQRSQQKDFLQTVLGNQTTDAVYKGADMLAAHKNLHITNAAYDATAENLINALVKCGVPTDVLNELGPIVESLRGDIVIKEQTLLEQIGGKNNLYKAVDLFYDRVLQDTRVNFYFKNTNMLHQRQQQKDFLEMVLGGSNNYQGKNMLESHKHLGCTDKVFDDIVGILIQTLVDLGVKQQTLQEIEQIIEPLRSDIVTVQNQPNSLYNRIGKKRLEGAIDIFYDRCLINNEINQYFKNTDINYLRQHQKQYLTQAFGGYQGYTGKNMKDAHQSLQIQKQHFQQMGDIFQQTLIDLSINQQDVMEAKQIWDSQLEFIVNQ